jgi:prevent-host-death family protein
VETIGLREFNQNPAGAIARVRAGALIVVTDRGKPVFRMVPEVDSLTALQRAVAAGEAQAPGELGMPDVVPDLAASIESLADLLLADRDRERRR